ncbi:MAG: hypothetical protein ABW122_03405, partial [Ilumatobacteraceae bacterium]
MSAPRPARGLVAALVILIGTGVASACDTDDGRSMRRPTDEERAVLSTTTTSTTLVGSSTPVAELPGGDAASTTTTLPLAVPTTSALV